MRESDSNTSSHGSSMDKHTPDTHPSQHPQPLVHRYFVPAILLLVVVIVSISTFQSKHAGNPVASISPDHSNGADSDQATTVSDGADSGTTPEGRTTGSEATVAAEAAPSPSSDENAVNSPPVSGTRTIGRALPRVLPRPYAGPMVHTPTYVDLLEQQRKAYHEAMQARQQYWARVRAYRASIQNRLQQDREAMYRRMQEIEQRTPLRPDQRLNRMEPVEELAVYNAT